MTSVLDLIPAGIVALSEDMRIVSANPAMAAMTGRTPAELIGQPVDVFLAAPSRILFQTHVYPTLRADGRVEEMFLHLAGGPDGAVPVLLNALRDGSGPDILYHVVVVRFQARSRWETDLLSATKALELERTASQLLADQLATRHEQETVDRRYRDAFMGVLSHELRTPITTIYGMSHVLEQRHTAMAPEVVSQHLADIVDEADRLHRLTEDLLIITRVEGRRLEIGREPIQIARLIERSVNSEHNRVVDHKFTINMPAQLPLVTGEDLYVEQVLRNYLNNAAKYSPAGTQVQVQAESADGGVEVRVLDSGPGLGDQQPDQLFELFYRSPDVLRQTSGAGIGLFVCRELISSMGGRVWAASRPEGGAEFGFWLPELVE